MKKFLGLLFCFTLIQCDDVKQKVYQPSDSLRSPFSSELYLVEDLVGDQTETDQYNFLLNEKRDYKDFDKKSDKEKILHNFYWFFLDTKIQNLQTKYLKEYSRIFSDMRKGESLAPFIMPFYTTRVHCKWTCGAFVTSQECQECKELREWHGALSQGLWDNNFVVIQHGKYFIGVIGTQDKEEALQAIKPYLKDL